MAVKKLIETKEKEYIFLNEDGDNVFTGIEKGFIEVLSSEGYTSDEIFTRIPIDAVEKIKITSKIEVIK